MLTNPNPIALVKLVEPDAVAQHRSLFCTYYDECLELAAESGWRSWSCERCPIYARRCNMTANYARENYHSARGADAVGGV